MLTNRNTCKPATSADDKNEIARKSLRIWLDVGMSVCFIPKLRWITPTGGKSWWREGAGVSFHTVIMYHCSQILPGTVQDNWACRVTVHRMWISNDFIWKSGTSVLLASNKNVQKKMLPKHMWQVSEFLVTQAVYSCSTVNSNCSLGNKVWLVSLSISPLIWSLH